MIRNRRNRIASNFDVAVTDQEQLVEYACHEGNVNLEFTFVGARTRDREEAEAEQQ